MTEDLIDIDEAEERFSREHAQAIELILEILHELGGEWVKKYPCIDIPDEYSMEDLGGRIGISGKGQPNNEARNEMIMDIIRERQAKRASTRGVRP